MSSIDIQKSEIVANRNEENIDDIAEPTSYDIDKFIEQLYQCKPLKEK